MPDLADRLAALRAKYSSMKPQIAEKIEGHIAELRADGGLDRVLKPGQRAPEFTLLDQSGATVRSADLLATGPLVVSFYRGTWCPYCNTEIDALAQMYPELHAAGANLVAISPQSAEDAREYLSKHAIPFPILVDPDASVAESFGLAYELPPYLQELYAGVFDNDLTKVNAGGTWRLPIPGRFVIAADGTILDAQVDPDYRYRPEPQATLDFVRTLTANIS